MTAPRFVESQRHRAVKQLVKARDAAAFSLRRTRAVNTLVFAPDDAQDTTGSNASSRGRKSGVGAGGGAMRRKLLLETKLGEGGYSTVWRVRERQPDGRSRALAVKRVVLDATDPEQAGQVRRELECMRALPPHPNILALEAYCQSRAAGRAGGVKEVYMLLELCRGGSLADLLMSRESSQPLLIPDVLKVFLELCEAIAHLHRQSPPIAHRDIKPENLLLSEADGHWKLCDFGSATADTFQYARDAPGSSAAVATEEDRIHRTSTPQYRAPEMCDLYAGLPICEAVDVWALGVCLYKMIFLRDLFGVAGEERLAILNFDAEKSFADARSLPHRPATPLNSTGGETLLTLLRMCLCKSPLRRPSAQKVLDWLSTQRANLPSNAPTSSPVSSCYAAGTLTLRVEAARNLFAKGSSSTGVDSYALVACGGTRKMTPTAPRTLNPQWRASLSLFTHSLQTVEISVWGKHSSTPDDFLGMVALPLQSLIGSSAKHGVDAGSSWRPLEKRSRKSRVSGEICFSLSWEPLPSSLEVSRGAAQMPSAVVEYGMVNVGEEEEGDETADGDGWAAFDEPSVSCKHVSSHSAASGASSPADLLGLEVDDRCTNDETRRTADESSAASNARASPWGDLLGFDGGGSFGAQPDAHSQAPPHNQFNPFASNPRGGGFADFFDAAARASPPSAHPQCDSPNPFLDSGFGAHDHGFGAHDKGAAERGGGAFASPSQPHAAQPHAMQQAYANPFSPTSGFEQLQFEPPQAHAQQQQQSQHQQFQQQQQQQQQQLQNQHFYHQHHEQQPPDSNPAQPQSQPANPFSAAFDDDFGSAQFSDSCFVAQNTAQPTAVAAIASAHTHQHAPQQLGAGQPGQMHGSMQGFASTAQQQFGADLSSDFSSLMSLHGSDGVAPVAQFSLQQGQFPPQHGQFPPQHGQFPSQQGQFGQQQGQFPPQHGYSSPQQEYSSPQQQHFSPQHGHFPPQQSTSSEDPMGDLFGWGRAAANTAANTTANSAVNSARASIHPAAAAGACAQHSPSPQQPHARHAPQQQQVTAGSFWDSDHTASGL